MEKIEGANTRNRYQIEQVVGNFIVIVFNGMNKTMEHL